MRYLFKMWYIINGFSFLWFFGFAILFLGLIFYRYIPRPQLLLLVIILFASVVVLSQLLYASRQTPGIDSYENFKYQIQTNEYTLVFLYSNYWIGCKTAKPIVDQLENNLQNAINVIRLDVMTDTGREFREQFSLQVTPGFVLLNSSSKELWQYIGIPNATKFIEQINHAIEEANV